MEPEADQSISVSCEPSTSIQAQVQEQEEGEGDGEGEEEEQPRTYQRSTHNERRRRAAGVNIVASSVGPNELKNDICSCLIVLISFLFLASVTVIIGFYGSEKLSLGPNCSRLIQVNPLFVQSIKAKEIDESNRGAVLYGFYEPPPLDVEITWSESHHAFIQSNSRKEWNYFLNKGSRMDISYSVRSPSSAPLSLVIAQGRENLVDWIEDPSYSNTTSSWNNIHGNGMIQQDIPVSKLYYIALANLNSEEVEVQLNFTIKAFIYNTTQAYHKCSLSNHLCNLKLFLASPNAAVLTSPGPEKGKPNDWHIRLSYDPRWITYFFLSGAMTFLIILAFRVSKLLRVVREGGPLVQAGEVGSERAPLLSQKDDDLSSWGSSYDSVSHDEEEQDEWVAVAPVSEKKLKEGANKRDPRQLCVICFDAQRDCFFLPCGHCATCFTCGTRVIEDTGICPICRRKMKKVRKIFTV